MTDERLTEDAALRALSLTANDIARRLSQLAEDVRVLNVRVSEFLRARHG
jgi:hypothetical protein